MFNDVSMIDRFLLDCQVLFFQPIDDRLCLDALENKHDKLNHPLSIEYASNWWSFFSINFDLILREKNLI